MLPWNEKSYRRKYLLEFEVKFSGHVIFELQPRFHEVIDIIRTIPDSVETKTVTDAVTKKKIKKQTNLNRFE